VRTLAGNYQLALLHPELLNPLRNRLSWQFVSHKLTRLAVPWCLLAVLGASGALALGGHRLAQLLLAAQGAFYLLAAAGAAAPAGRGRRWLTVPWAFVLLNLAAASGLVGFLRGTERAAWKASRP
jgi:hypothetical protein